MTNWKHFIDAAPELAAFARSRLERFAAVDVNADDANVFRIVDQKEWMITWPVFIVDPQQSTILEQHAPADCVIRDPLGGRGWRS